MGAEFFTVDPRPARNSGDWRSMGRPARLREVHRWTSIAFTLMVVANFAAMVRGPVPVIITYSPLPPLVALAFTGLHMFARHTSAKHRRASPTKKG